MCTQAVFFKDYDRNEELKIMVNKNEIRISSTEAVWPVVITPEVAREVARVLNLYATMAEGYIAEIEEEQKMEEA